MKHIRVIIIYIYICIYITHYKCSYIIFLICTVRSKNKIPHPDRCSSSLPCQSNSDFHRWPRFRCFCCHALKATLINCWKITRKVRDKTKTARMKITIARRLAMKPSLGSIFSWHCDRRRMHFGRDFRDFEAVETPVFPHYSKTLCTFGPFGWLQIQNNHFHV